MINKNENPVEWALLIYELDDEKEHLESLIDIMTTSENFEEIDFGVALGHVFSHINRAWNAREHLGEVTTEDFENYSKMPTDLRPV